jgi:hypothetical protein
MPPDAPSRAGDGVPDSNEGQSRSFRWELIEC